MTYIDSALLSLVERLCHGFQRLTGRTNVWLAMQLTNLSIIVYFATAVGYFWIGTLALRIGLGLFCVGLFYLLTQTIFKVPVEAYENSEYRRVAKGLRNPRRLRDALLRILFLTLSLVLAFPSAFVYLNLRIGVVLLTYSLIVLTTVLLYLLACDPLPPCVGKVTEWLRGSAASRVEQEKDPVVTTEVGTSGAYQQNYYHLPRARGAVSPAVPTERSVVISTVHPIRSRVEEPDRRRAVLRQHVP